MDKFTPEYIQNVQQIIKNDEKDKARELLKDLHPARRPVRLSARWRRYESI